MTAPAAWGNDTTWGNDTEQAFFEQMRGCREAYRRLGDAIHAVLGKHEAWDIGCGVGDATERLAELGWSICGLEFSQIARSMCRAPVMSIDLTRPVEMDTFEPAEVVICTETAEHLPEMHEEDVIAHVVARARKWIVFSAAQPGQEWPGHVNLKPIEYWAGEFGRRGWKLDVAKTGALRAVMWGTLAQHMYCKGNFCVFEKVGAP